VSNNKKLISTACEKECKKSIARRSNNNDHRSGMIKYEGCLLTITIDADDDGENGQDGIIRSQRRRKEWPIQIAIIIIIKSNTNK